MSRKKRKEQLAHLCVMRLLSDSCQYLMVLGHYKLVLLGTWLYSVHILNKVEIWLSVTDVDRQRLTDNKI